MKVRNVILLSVLVYIILFVRYLFQFPSNETIYIEDQKVKVIRNDDRMTIYEYPPTIKYKGSILSELRLHRCFYSRQFHCTAPSNMQIQIVVFSPEQTKNLYPNMHLLRLSQTSPINVNSPQLDKYPRFKSAEYAEVPIIGGQSFVLPRGWWILINSPSHIRVKSF